MTVTATETDWLSPEMQMAAVASRQILKVTGSDEHRTHHPGDATQQCCPRRALGPARASCLFNWGVLNGDTPERRKT